ncbi:MAG: SpoIIE family protein phosphatase, partial [Clostridia bacterium]|nr:SpoIIE family protein phosphatase [Clostridia bacterium]
METTKLKTTIISKGESVAYAVFAFLLGVAPLASGVMPFGCALLCAVPAGRLTAVFLGVLASCIFDKCIPLAIFCAIFLFLVLKAKEKSGGVMLHTRVLLSLSISALRIAYIAVIGVNGIEDIFVLLAALISYPAFTVAFMGFFDRKKELHQKRYDISLLALAFAVTMFFSRFTVGALSLAFLPASVFTLCAARTRGFGFGGVCGVLCGLVSGGAATGALGVLGMTYGMLVTDIEPLALILSYMLAITGFFYLSGASGVAEAALILLCVYGIFIPLRKNLKIRRSVGQGGEKRSQDRKLTKYAAAFSSLSSLFYTVSESTREESVTDLNNGIVGVVERHCSHCTGCELDRSEISNFFTSEIRRNGVAAYSRIPTHISSRCPDACLMAREINNLPTERELDGEKGLKQMADEYSYLSTILIDAAKKQEDTLRVDKPLAQEIKRALNELGVTCDGVRVTGTRMRDIMIYGVDPEKIKVSPNEIAKAVALKVGTAISAPELVLHDEYVLMKMHSVPAFRVECAKISEAKTGETVCGDTVSVFENDDRYFYCLVSDGMGSGRDAALTSRLSSIMLEKLLSVGAEKESALKLLNKALLEKNEEIFATVDLLEIDRVLCRATLIKAGAAPTLMIRNGRLRTIEAKTPPAGIMKNVIADKKCFTLEKGDMLVMMSDGILQTGSPNTLLPKSGIPPMPSARALASTIFREAQHYAEAVDDMS